MIATSNYHTLLSHKKIQTIGIITHRGNYNYGGLLQALALQRWLMLQGFEVEIINLNRMQLYGTRLGRILRAFLTPKKTIRKLKAVHKQVVPPEEFLQIFSKFKVYAKMIYSPEVSHHNIGKIANHYDAIIIGSDQVWCYKYSRPLIFFGHWSPSYKGHILSYAACSPDADIPWYNKNLIKKQLVRFNEISVRDMNTMKWVESLCGRTPLIVADPTLLYDFNEFIEVDKINEPYILSYCIGSEINGGHAIVINEIRKHYGFIKIIGVTIPNQSKEVEKFADEVIYNASPQRWLTLLKHASFVYTDSFHGCIFSLKFKKQFLAYYAQQNRASRLIDLKERYGLEYAIVASASEVQQKQCLQVGVNYEKTDLLLEQHILLSKNFLKKALCSIKE